MKKKRFSNLSIALLIVVLSFLIFLIVNQQTKAAKSFEPERAWQHVVAQLDFGPRTPGSEAHQNTIDYIEYELRKNGWSVEIQKSERMGHPIQNVIAKRGRGNPWIILGAHYDSRFVADQDLILADQALPVPGANDGASGVAILLEMARVLPRNSEQQIWLVFFDAEDQGRIEGWDWILGSRAFVETLTSSPDAVVVIDMIGDSDLNIYREISSDAKITDEIWQTAIDLGYKDQFINKEKFNILDDHLPFLELGIPAIDIIDFDYPYWHTTEDTLDKLSPESLAVVGNTLLTWITSDQLQK